MRKKLSLILIPAISGLFIAATSWQQLLKVKTPRPNLVLVVDASENLVQEHTQCVGCYQTQQVTEHLTKTYIYPVPDSSVNPQSYINRAVSEFKSWINENYANPTISSLQTSYSFTHGIVITYIYASTATRSGSTQRLVLKTNPENVGGYSTVFPKVLKGVDSSRTLINYTHYPVTTWQAYYDYDITPGGHNAKGEYYYVYNQQRGPQEFFRPVQFNKHSGMSIKLKDCVEAILGYSLCRISFIYPYSTNCTGTSVGFNSGNITGKIHSLASMIFPTSRATTYINRIVEAMKSKYGSSSVSKIGSPETNWTHAAVTLTYFISGDTSGGRTLCPPTGACSFPSITMKIPASYVREDRTACVGASDISFNFVVRPDEDFSSQSVRIKENGTDRTITVKYGWFVRQKVRMPGNWHIQVTVGADITYDKQVWNPCCYTQIIKDKSEFYAFRDAIRDWVLTNRHKADIYVFVSGGKISTGSVEIVRPSMSADEVRQAFGFEPAGAGFPASLSMAEVLRWARGQTSVSRSEGAPDPAMGISNAPVSYSDPYNYWCRNSYEVVIAAGADASNRSSSYYGDIPLSDFDGDNEGGSAISWNTAGDDFGYYNYNTDLRGSLDEFQNIPTYTIGYKFNDLTLTRTAEQGGGKAYTANDTSSLISALNDMLADILSRENTYYAWKGVDTLYNDQIFPYAVEYGYVGTKGVLRLHKVIDGEIQEEVVKALAEEIKANSSQRVFYAVESDGTIRELSSYSASDFGLRSEEQKALLLKAIREQFPAIVSLEIQLSPALYKRPEADYWNYLKDHTAERWWVLYAWGTDGSLHIIRQGEAKDVVYIPKKAFQKLYSFYVQGFFPSPVRAHSIKLFTLKIEGDPPEFEDWVFFHYGNKVFSMNVQDIHTGDYPSNANVYNTKNEDFEIKVYPTESGADVLVMPGSLIIQAIGGGETTIEGEFAGISAIDVNANFKVDYIYATTSDGKIIRIDGKSFETSALLVNAEPFSIQPTVAGGADRNVWVYAVSGNYETATAGKVYAIKESHSSAPADAGNLSSSQGWSVSLPPGYYPMPWSKPVVFAGVLYVPVVHENTAVPYCSLCLNARTFAYSTANGTLLATIQGTLSPKLRLKKKAGRNIELEGRLYSVGVRNIKRFKSEVIEAPEKIYKHLGTIYRRKNQRD